MQNIIKLVDNSNVYDVAKVTPLSLAHELSARFNNNIYLKREDEQSIHSFKLRGAYQKISTLKNCVKGVITASAGNHAQGVALAAKKLNIEATIVMPIVTPNIKVQAVKALGGEIVFYGDTYDDAYKHARKLEQKKSLIFIHPYDDIEVIIGQATIAKELLTQLEVIDRIFVPVGGGGLIAGIAIYIKHHMPNTKIIGVEPMDSATLWGSLKKGRRIILKEVGNFADGVAIKQIGKVGFEMISKTVDCVVLVSNDEICAAIKDIYEDTRCIAEPSGALATAGIKRYIKDNNISGENIVSLVSGANVNFDRLRHIAERADLGECNEAIIAVTIPEKAGSFLKFCQLLNNYSITEFNYRYACSEQAHVFVGVALSNGITEKQVLIEQLSQSFEVVDMSDNSMAKTHIRYMVGGRANVSDEVIYRFIFPERPKALLNFLQIIGNDWNISLFHYRNHGADFGRVLIGMQVSDIMKLENRFEELGYFYKNETNNKAYKLFL